MSGIYIHIPFCKQACHYCDFHFSTSLKNKPAMFEALQQELIWRQQEFLGQTVETIYFGGGTPSLLTDAEIGQLIQTVYRYYQVSDNPEITLEANPDDLSRERIASLALSPVNRLSIGIQSFFEQDLKLMNRAHNASEAKKCLEEACNYFDNISVDLIYGIPDMSHARWKQNIETALSFGIPHLSSYALTVEPKTALQLMIQKGVVPQPEEQLAQEHFEILVETLAQNGFLHYELSNFGKPGFFSRNNTAYWLGKKYIGIGPSAHSYDGQKRGWNVANNNLYLKAIQAGKLPMDTETLTPADRYNEYIMTGLRTMWGVSLEKIEAEFGKPMHDYLQKQSRKFLESGLLVLEKGHLKAAAKGKFLTDGIASDLFLVNLD